MDSKIHPAGNSLCLLSRFACCGFALPFGAVTSHRPRSKTRVEPKGSHPFKNWRREGDSNPRYAYDAHTLSKRAL